MSIYTEILEKYWGYSSFRPLQEEIIQSVCAGKDTLGLMPTGGGKSITFQVPALSMQGICIVVTPLIALMKDQVDNLRSLGIKATAVYSGMSRHEIITQLENCIFGDYKFLYISPERIKTELFISKMQAMNVCLLVIDESHCISQWGYDFRPSYLNIAEIRQLIPKVPVMALTATATPEVVDDIQKKLCFKEKNVFQKSFERENISYIVRRTEDKFKELVHILSKVDGTAIVYVRNRKSTKEIALELKSAGINADYYHAGLNQQVKVDKQNAWKKNECRVIVSTNAFGMGIDKPDVRVVVHMEMPGSLEEYYQEAGRAGRDGKRAYAVALCCKTDTAKLKKRLSDEFPDKDFIKRVYEALGNYYQIAVGYGMFTIHDFKLNEFCSVFKLPILQTHYALKLLELAGYIEYTEEVDSASRVMFSMTRDELYRLNNNDRDVNIVLQTLLRSYTGLFSDYVYIDERLLSARSGMSQQAIYEVLKSLSNHHILHYIPHKRTPFIIYRSAREDLQYLTIPRAVYEDRYKRFEHRILKVLEYINDEYTCRSKMLLSYFAENNAKDCGCCDVCVSKNKSGLTNYDYNKYKNIILDIVKEHESIELNSLIDKSQINKDSCIAVIRYMIDLEQTIVNQNGLISIK